MAITIDILDNGTEHCLLIKSLASPEKILRPIFNMQPSVLFSPDGRSVYYVQRSAEGGWIELVKREVTSCWGKRAVTSCWGPSDLALVGEEEEEEEIVYRCSP